MMYIKLMQAVMIGRMQHGYQTSFRRVPHELLIVGFQELAIFLRLYMCV